MSGLTERLKARAKLAREEQTGTALGDALHFEEAAATIESLDARLASARKALEEIARWKNDTLGPRPKEFGPFDCDPSISSAFDRGVRMAFYRCADRATVALTDEEGK